MNRSCMNMISFPLSRTSSSRLALRSNFVAMADPMGEQQAPPILIDHVLFFPVREFTVRAHDVRART